MKPAENSGSWYSKQLMIKTIFVAFLSLKKVKLQSTLRNVPI